MIEKQEQPSNQRHPKMHSRPSVARYLLHAAIILIVIVLVFAPSYMNNNWRANCGHVAIIGDYFTRMGSQGWEVDPSTPPKTMYVDTNTSCGEVRTKEVLTWRMRQTGSANWVSYTWELYPVNQDTLALLAARGIPTDGWWMSNVKTGFCAASSADHPYLAGYKTILLPSNEAALVVHRQLRLRLPSSFSIK